LRIRYREVYLLPIRPTRGPERWSAEATCGRPANRLPTPPIVDAWRPAHGLGDWNFSSIAFRGGIVVVAVVVMQ
jgi:hypothetical protein